MTFVLDLARYQTFCSTVRGGVLCEELRVCSGHRRASLLLWNDFEENSFQTYSPERLCILMTSYCHIPHASGSGPARCQIDPDRPDLSGNVSMVGRPSEDGVLGDLLVPPLLFTLEEVSSCVMETLCFLVINDVEDPDTCGRAHQ